MFSSRWREPRVRALRLFPAESLAWLRISFVEKLGWRCVGGLQAAVDAAAEHVVAVEDFVAVDALAVFCW